MNSMNWNILKAGMIMIIGVCVMMTLNSCSRAGGNNPGTEYMPDMGHSIAYEANVSDYYYYNTWGSEENYEKLAQPRQPVKGTVPRGYAGIGVGDDVRAESMIGYSMSGHVPYHYGDTEEERTRASQEILHNPFPISEDGLARGKALYTIQCAICHGDKADGDGYLVSESNPKAVYPAQPAILTSEDFVKASAGQLYHAIMYGKNVMGSYADKLSYEERWQVIHYVRSLQAKAAGLEYSASANTFNASEALPLALWTNDPSILEQDEEMSQAQADSTEDHNKNDH